MVVGEGKLGQALHGDLAVVGRAADVAVAQLADGLGGDGVDLGVGVLERGVPRPVAGALSAEIEDPSAVAGHSVSVGGHAREAGEPLGHGCRDEAAAVEQLGRGDVPGTHAHLVEGVRFLVGADLLGVVDDDIVAARDIGAHALLRGERNDGELILAEQLVPVLLGERDALCLQCFEAGLLVHEDVGLVAAHGIVGESPIIG